MRSWLRTSVYGRSGRQFVAQSEPLNSQKIENGHGKFPMAILFYHSVCLDRKKEKYIKMMEV